MVLVRGVAVSYALEKVRRGWFVGSAPAMDGRVLVVTYRACVRVATGERALGRTKVLGRWRATRRWN